MDGKWEEVDNTLTLSATEDGLPEYRTTNGIADVRFSQSAGSKLITIEEDGYSISWGVQAVPRNTSVMSATVTQITAAQAELVPLDLSGISAEEQKMMASKSSSTIQYSNALAQGVDLKYTVLPSRVKEDIILRSPQKISAYTVTIYTGSLSAQLLENKEVTFTNSEGEIIFTMHAPYMFDSTGELSEDIEVALIAKGTGCYILTMTPDASWLGDPSRVYPVVIDPYVSPSSAKSNIIDNYVLQYDDAQNSSLDRLYIGKKNGLTARAYIRFQAMPYIPATATIDMAHFRLELTSGTSTTNSIDVYQVTGDTWDSSTITWSNKPAAKTIICSSASARTDSNGKLMYYISCVNGVRSWYSGSVTGNKSNYGFMIRYTSESINDYNAVYSADTSTASQRPSLSIHYTPPASTQTTIVWPTPGHYNVTSEWGYRNYDSEMHLGIDISCNEINVVAAIGGTVYTSFTSHKGYIMIIEKPESEFQAHYYHLKEGGYLVKDGTTVTPGQKIAISGNTGDSGGPHLHFQLQYTDDDRKSYNPLDIYHPNDTRSACTNPNPMFYLVNGIYVPNESFNYTYAHSKYNDTSDAAWKK